MIFDLLLDSFFFVFVFRFVFCFGKSVEMEINSANLKKWIEENNIEMLEGVVLEGHGERLQKKATSLLKRQHSNDDISNNDLFMTQNYIEKTVPIIMNKIQNLHQAVSMGDLTILKKNDFNMKNDYILSKDHFGMTPLHKATIMGHVEIVQYILEKFPETINAKDREGRTALHYSTATTNRNGNKIYKMLIKAGADSRVRDSVNIEKNFLLNNSNKKFIIFSFLLIYFSQMNE